ncbi:MAG: response regulator transcription factor [Bacteroidota bacterium]
MTDLIRCLLVDDERIARQILRSFIEQIPGLQLVAECRDAFSAQKILESESVDLLLLDIQMPRLSGIDLLNQLTQAPVTVLTTAFSDFALESYSLDVVDYLLKPIRKERFEEAISKVRRRLTIADELLPTKSEPYIVIRANQQQHKVMLQDIVYIQSLKEYVKIKLSDNRQLISLMALKQLEASLPTDQFLRIHRSYIVALDYVTAASSRMINLGDRQLRVGGKYRQLVVDRILSSFQRT